MKKWIFATIGLLFLIGIPALAHAEYLPEIVIGEENKYNIAFLPQSIPVYQYKNVRPVAELDTAKLEKAILKQALNNPYLHVLTPEEIQDALKSASLSQTDAYMQAEIDMGYARDYLNNMKYTSAIELTRKVVDNYQKSYMQYVHPQTVAAAYQQLAYALIGKYQENPDAEYELLHPARLAFLELFRLAPQISMIEGRQARERVMLYNEALELFLSNEAYRQIPQNDAAELARMLQADILFFPRIVEDKSGALMLEIDQYSARDRQMTRLHKRMEFPRQMSPDEYAQDITTWMLTNSYICHNSEKQHLRTVEATSEHSFFFDVGLSYSSFIRRPTDALPNIVGGHVLFSYRLNQYIFLRSGIKIAEVLQDKAHELFNNFEIYEFPLLVGVMLRWDRVNLYFTGGLNFGISSSFTITTSTACKTFGLYDRECNPASVTENDDPFSINLDLAAGASFGVAPFYAAFEAYINPTLFPAEGRVYRHAFGGRVSLQYWF